MEFQNLNKALKAMDTRMADIVKNVSFEMSKDIIMGTPEGKPSLWKRKPPKGYKPGTLRAAWSASIGEPDKSITKKVKGRNYKRAIQQAKRFCSQIKPGSKPYFLTNAVSYGYKIEMLGHSSIQAPAGMMRIVRARAGQYLKRAISSKGFSNEL